MGGSTSFFKGFPTIPQASPRARLFIAPKPHIGRRSCANLEDHRPTRCRFVCSLRWACVFHSRAVVTSGGGLRRRWCCGIVLAAGSGSRKPSDRDKTRCGSCRTPSSSSSSPSSSSSSPLSLTPYSELKERQQRRRREQVSRQHSSLCCGQLSIDVAPTL